MNPSQIGGVIRATVGFIAGISGVLGWLNGVDWVAVASVATAIGTGAWSLWTNRTAGMVKAVVATDDVHEVDATPELAAAVNHPKVVAVMN